MLLCYRSLGQFEDSRDWPKGSYQGRSRCWHTCCQCSNSSCRKYVITPAATQSLRASLIFSKGAYRVHMQSWGYKDPVVQSEIIANAKELMTAAVELLTQLGAATNGLSVHVSTAVDELAL